ncbi:MAG: hypothetical protein JXN61_07230 [Sedimentisphaerales bacterium]|nr:hypothetical protein [Sedimentisphaerales bacterium]
MKEFLRENRRLLEFYCVAGRIIGWLLIIGGVVWFGAMVASGVGKGIEYSTGLLTAELLLFMISAMLFDFMLPGVVALGVTELITYFYQPQAKPGFIISRAHKILYAYAFFLVIRTWCGYWWVVQSSKSNSWSRQANWAFQTCCLPSRSY